MVGCRIRQQYNHTNKQTTSPTTSTTAQDELRTLYSLRLILPTSSDLTEMIIILQHHWICAMSNKLDLKRQREIIECEYQLESEEQSEQSMPPKQYNIRHIIPKAFMDVYMFIR